MKQIGDVMRTFSIPISTSTDSTSTEEAAYSCPICKDAGYLRMDVPLGHPQFGRLIACQCTVARREEQLEEELRRVSNLDSFSERTFDTFNQSIEGVEEAFDEAVSFARNPHGWLFFHGNCGCGKTHLGVAIANYAMERQKMRVLFAVVPDLLDHLRATFDPSNGVAYDERFNTIRNAQLLILDDLGTENATPWAREKLYQIFNHRYNEQLPTVITSNQDFRKIDDRVVSRLLDHNLSRYVHIDAEDFRRRRVAPTPTAPRRR